MEIGPLEYVVIGVPDQKFTHALVSELNAIHSTGTLRVVDMIFITKASDGSVTTQEVSEFIEQEPEALATIAEDLMGLLTVQDIEQLTEQVPIGTSAIVVIFEHTWVIRLTEEIRKGDGTVLGGGMIAHETLKQLSDELAAAKEVVHDA
jgi:Family of unknown function (DUF6325)